MNHHETWKLKHRQGSVVCTGDRGVGISTLLSEFARRHEEAQVHEMPHMHRREDVLAFLVDALEIRERVEDMQSLTRLMMEMPGKVIVLDDLEHMFVRSVGGYDGIQALCQLISHTDHVHFWVVGCAQQTWNFLQKISELGQYFGHELVVPRWTTQELRALLLGRTEEAGMIITFQSLDSNATGANVVKTEEGYFRYLEDFVRGNPAAALHYWCQSLCVEIQGSADFSVQLFERRHAQVLTKLGDRHAFLLSALVHYSDTSLAPLAEAMNLSESKCRTLLDRLDDLQSIVWREDELITIKAPWYPLVLRYLSDSNLLLS